MRLALRFISGKYQGGEFPLEDNREIIVGRSSDLDMVLVEEMVSRRHARIQLVGGSVNIDDLGSTNGTFVNGERVTHAELQEGDRVLIGSNILKVVATDGQAPLSDVVEQQAHMNRAGARATGGDARMSGNLEEIPLPDLLQLFGSSRKTGTLVVTSDGRLGRIHLRGGLVHQVEAETDSGERLQLPGLKVIYRMLSWERGLFELTPEDPRKFEAPLDLNVQEVLMEGFRQKDELAQIVSRIPAAEASVKVSFPLEPKLSQLKPEQLDVFQAVLNSSTVGTLLDSSPFEDLKTSQILLDLIQRGYVEG
jgi:Domain of unknown function (DUF4388)/Inner membrane component of T3SS, cytoplasmic domain